MKNKKIKTINEETLVDLQARGYKVETQHLRYIRTNLGNVLRDTKYWGSETIQNAYILTEHMYAKPLISQIISSDESKSVHNKGGCTLVQIYQGDKLVGNGEAQCSLEDVFDSSFGFHIALQRAKQNANL